MIDWIKTLLGRPIKAKRHKVHIDMRYEEHSYKSHEPHVAKPDSIKQDDINTESVEPEPTK